MYAVKVVTIGSEGEQTDVFTALAHLGEKPALCTGMLQDGGRIVGQQGELWADHLLPYGLALPHQEVGFYQGRPVVHTEITVTVIAGVV